MKNHLLKKSPFQYVLLVGKRIIVKVLRGGEFCEHQYSEVNLFQFNGIYYLLGMISALKDDIQGSSHANNRICEIKLQVCNICISIRVSGVFSRLSLYRIWATFSLAL